MLALLREETAVSQPLHTSYFGEVYLLRELSIWDLSEAAEEASYQPSSGVMSLSPQ